MCGIVAIQGLHATDTLVSMMDKISHRGPDEKGIFNAGNISLGHVRLSIVDVAGGHQPIFNEDKSKCIIFNGEIYNHKELRQQLKQSHRFATQTDTEIIMHLYEEEGIDCLKKLDGMFTFALYDNGKLFLARDRLGIKPLYYGAKNDTTYFASEFKALLHCDTISVFLPGYYYYSGSGFAQYYELPQRKHITADTPSIIKALRTLLGRAVEKRLMADVPVGVFLSGGIDSSIVAAIMRSKIPHLHSFCVGMKGSADLEHAAEVANYLHLDHHDFTYDEHDVMMALPEVIYHLESFNAPLVRSAVPCNFVSRLAKQHGIKVVLTGEGADELFSGYQYLKTMDDERALFNELYRITYNLHNTNLQRVDRLTMAHSVEGRVPFLDLDFLTFVFSIPMALKESSRQQEKWLLREAFKHMLPPSVINRPKQKFSAGAGSMETVKTIVEQNMSDQEFNKEKNGLVRTKEELYYYDIFKQHFSHPAIPQCIGRTEVF